MTFLLTFFVFVVSNSHSSAFTFILCFFPLSDEFGDVCVCTDRCVHLMVKWSSLALFFSTSNCSSESELWSGRWSLTRAQLHSHEQCLSVSVIHDHCQNDDHQKKDKSRQRHIYDAHRLCSDSLMKELKRDALPFNKSC